MNTALLNIPNIDDKVNEYYKESTTSNAYHWKPNWNREQQQKYGDSQLCIITTVPTIYNITETPTDYLFKMKMVSTSPLYEIPSAHTNHILVGLICRIPYTEAHYMVSLRGTLVEKSGLSKHYTVENILSIDEFTNRNEFIDMLHKYGIELVEKLISMGVR